MLTSLFARRTRTVTLRRARVARAFSWACALVCAVALLFALPGPAWLLIAPGLGLVLSVIRALRWRRVIRRALTSPDQMRWKP